MLYSESVRRNDRMFVALLQSRPVRHDAPISLADHRDGSELLVRRTDYEARYRRFDTNIVAHRWRPARSQRHGCGLTLLQ